MNGGGEELGDDGSFTLQKVWPSKYTAVISEGGVYVKSMQLGSVSIEGSKLDLSSGAGGAALTVRVAAAKGVISGSVQTGNGPANDARVILADDVGGLGSVRVTNSQPDGSYVFTGVAPGKYLIFATDEGGIAFWTSHTSAGEMVEMAEKIEVHDQETVSKDLKRH
jgi:hypothetical protein